MDERCESAIEFRHTHQSRLQDRCRDCSHVWAAHGLDGHCDLCALKRSIDRSS